MSTNDSSVMVSVSMLVSENERKSFRSRQKATSTHSFRWFDRLDKRAKRLAMTTAGASVLQACYQKLAEVNELCFGDLAEEQVKLCIQLLQPVEASLARLWLADKKK